MKQRSATQRSLLFSFLTCIAACGLIAIFCLLTGGFSDLALNVFVTTGVTGAASVLAMIGAATWELRRWHPIGPLSMAAAGIALLLTLPMIWLDPMWNFDSYYKLVIVAWVAAVAFSHVALLSMARLHDHYEWIRVLTVAAIAVLGAQFSYTVITEMPDPWWFRLLGVVAVLNVCGTIAVPILHRISAIRVVEETQSYDVEAGVQMTCPRCETQRRAPLGPSRCEVCQLRTTITIDEEHCPKCGYSLYKLTSTTCPECGASVAAEMAG